MRLLRSFIETIRYYCQGKGSPWRLILIWYFLLNIAAFSVGFGTLFLSDSLIKTGWLVSQILAVGMLVVVGCLGQIITFIYPFIFVYALWKCAFNVKWELLGFMIGFLMFPFLFAHFILGRFYFFGSIMMFSGMFEVVKKWLLPIQ